MTLIQEKTNTCTNDMTEKLLEELYSKADIMFFLLDSEGMITSSNITAQETLEYEKEELIGKKFLTLLKRLRSK